MTGTPTKAADPEMRTCATKTRGWRNVDPEPRVGGPAEGRKKKVTPAILMAEVVSDASVATSDGSTRVRDVS